MNKYSRISNSKYLNNSKCLTKLIPNWLPTSSRKERISQSSGLSSQSRGRRSLGTWRSARALIAAETLSSQITATASSATRASRTSETALPTSARPVTASLYVFHAPNAKAAISFAMLKVSPRPTAKVAALTASAAVARTLKPIQIGGTARSATTASATPASHFMNDKLLRCKNTPNARC